MPRKPNQEQYILSQERNQAIFDRIKRNLLVNSIKAKNPQAIFLGGQSGSGKSSLAEYLSNNVNENEGCVIVNSDALREYHPEFPFLQKTDVDQASFLVNPDTIIWQQKLISTTIETKRNILLDGTLGGNPAPILKTIQLLRKGGYQVQVSVLAVPARLSRFGIYKRYEDQVALKGTGRWVGMQNHDRLYDEVPKTLILLETKKVVDQIQIYARPINQATPALLYDNRLKDGQWVSLPAVTTALTEGRNRTWTAQEQDAFLAAVQAVAGQMRQRGADQEAIETFYRYVECPI